MAKYGIIHDYDLMANREESAQDQACRICDASPMRFQWSDYSGEAMCTRCGCPYQLKWGNQEQQDQDAYPYFKFNAEFTPIAREYFRETGKFVCYGQMLGPKPGYGPFTAWVRIHYPEWIKEDS